MKRRTTGSWLLDVGGNCPYNAHMTDTLSTTFKKRLLRKWKYSYLAVIVLPIILIVSLSITSLRSMNRAVTEVNSLAVRFMYHEFDTVFTEVNALSQELLLSPSMQRLSRASDTSELDSFYLYETAMTLSRMLGRGSVVTDMMIFSPSLDYYISTSRWGTLENLPLLNDFSLPWSAERYQTVFGTSPKTLMIEDATCCLVGGSTLDRILIIRPLSFAQSGWQHEFSIALLVDITPQIVENLGLLQDFLIVNKVSNRVLYNFGDLYKTGDDAGVLGEIPSGESRRIGNSIATVASSAVSNSNYVVLMDRGSYFRTLVISSLVSLGYILVALVGGWAIMRWRIGKDWALYEEALVQSGSSLDEEEYNGVYGPFVTSVSRLRMEKEGMGQIIHDQTKKLRSHLVARLMAGSKGTVSAEALAASGVALRSNLFIVVIICSADYSLDETQEQQLIAWFEENGYEVLPTATPHGIALIINTDEEVSTTEALALKVGELKAGEGGSALQVVSSDVVEGLNNLGRAYLDAVNVLEYQRSIGSLEFMTNRDMLEMSSQTNYIYTSEQELRLAQLIQSAKSEEATDLVEKVLEANRSDGVSPQRLRYLLFAIAGTVVRTANQLEGRYPGLIPSLLLPPILQTDDFERSIKSVDEMIGQLCSAVAHIERQFACEGGIQYDIYRQALALIHFNYNDPMVNVSYIADEIGVSATFLSRIFKKYHLQNISDYLSVVRVEAAKSLLAEGMSLAEVVDACGFGSLRTFMRVFKSIEHITPGQYRTLVGMEQE